MDPYDIYPDKPVLRKQEVKSNWGLTFFTIVLFVAIFLSLYSDQVSFVFSLVFALAVHESGHFIAMKWFKYENVKMLFIPLMGAFVQGHKSVFSQKESLIVVSAGPFPGVVFGTVGMILSTYLHWDWLLTLSFIFMFLNVVNLLPIDPLDGGQLFKLFVIKQRDLFLMLFALGSSLLMILVGYLISDWLVVIFGFLMGIRVRAMQRNYILRKELSDMEVNYVNTYEDLSNRDFHVMKQLVLQKNPALKDVGDLPTEQMNAIVASFVNDLLIPPVIKDTKILLKLSILVFWLISILLPFVLLLTLDFNWYFEKL